MVRTQINTKIIFKIITTQKNKIQTRYFNIITKTHTSAQKSDACSKRQTDGHTVYRKLSLQDLNHTHKTKIYVGRLERLKGM